MNQKNLAAAETYEVREKESKLTELTSLCDQET